MCSSDLLQATAINLGFGAKLTLQASELPGSGQAQPEPLLLELGDAPAGVTDGVRLRSPDPTGSLQLQRLQTTLPFTIEVGGRLSLAGPVAGQRLDLEAGVLDVSPQASTLSASERLVLRQGSSDPWLWGDLVPTAPSLSLSSGGDLKVNVKANDLELNAAGQIGRAHV